MARSPARHLALVACLALVSASVVPAAVEASLNASNASGASPSWLRGLKLPELKNPFAKPSNGTNATANATAAPAPPAKPPVAPAPVVKARAAPKERNVVVRWAASFARVVYSLLYALCLTSVILGLVVFVATLADAKKSKAAPRDLPAAAGDGAATDRGVVAAATHRDSSVGFEDTVTVNTPEATGSTAKLDGSHKSPMRQPTPFSLGAVDPEEGARGLSFRKDVTIDASGGDGSRGFDAATADKTVALDGAPRAALRQPTPAHIDFGADAGNTTTSAFGEETTIGEEASDPFLSQVHSHEAPVVARPPPGRALTYTRDDAVADGATVHEASLDKELDALGNSVAPEARRAAAEAEAEKKASNCVCVVS